METLTEEDKQTIIHALSVALIDFEQDIITMREKGDENLVETFKLYAQNCKNVLTKLEETF